MNDVCSCSFCHERVLEISELKSLLVESDRLLCLARTGYSERIQREEILYKEIAALKSKLENSVPLVDFEKL